PAPSRTAPAAARRDRPMQTAARGWRLSREGREEWRSCCGSCGPLAQHIGAPHRITRQEIQPCNDVESGCRELGFGRRGRDHETVLVAGLAARGSLLLELPATPR